MRDLKEVGVDALQRRLMEKEVLDREEVYALVRENATGPVPEVPAAAGHAPREAPARP